ARQRTDARLSQKGTYIEAENGQLEGGFVIEDDALVSGGRFISPTVGQPSEDVPGPARARYELTATETGAYQIWGRIHGPDLSQNRLWIQVDQQVWYKWRITTGDE